MIPKFTLRAAISFTAGLAATATCYLVAGPFAATAARHAVWGMSNMLGYNVGVMGNFSTWMAAEQAGFHVMSNILPYSTVAGGVVAKSVNYFFDDKQPIIEEVEVSAAAAAYPLICN